MSPHLPDAAIVEQLVRQIPGFPTTRKGRERYISYDSQGRVWELNLYRRGLTQVPAELGKLAQLEQLNLFGNKLPQLPMELSHLGKLRWLKLSHNRLTHLASELVVHWSAL